MTSKFSISGAAPALQNLLHKAAQHVSTSLHHRTQQSYSSVFQKFFKFLLMHGLSMVNISLQSIMAFIEFSVAQGLVFPTICNHISAIKSQCIRFQLPSAGFASPLVTRVLKSIDLNVSRHLTHKLVYAISHLLSLVDTAKSHPLGLFPVPIFLLGFFAFLQISNIVSKSKFTWDSHVTLLRKDLIINSSSMDIILRWSKSRQSRSKFSRV